MSTFKLVTHGHVLDEFNAEDCRASVAKLFKLTPEAPQLKAIFSGRAVSLKKGLTAEQVEKYVQTLASVGLVCESQAEESAIEPPSDPVANEVSPAPDSVTTNEPEVMSKEVASPELVNDQEAQATPPADMSTAEPPVESSLAQSIEANAGEVTTASTESSPSADYNPYQQPESDLEVEHDSQDFELVEPNKLPAGNGWAWIKEGYTYVKMRMGLWIGAVLLFWVLMMVFSIIPLVSILVNLFMPVLVAGFMWMAYQQHQDEEIGLGDMFAGFKRNVGTLVAVGTLYLAGTVLVFLLVFVLMFVTMGGFAAMSGAGMDPSPLILLLIVLLAMGAMIPVVMAYWFAPALVMLHDMGAVEAMKLSFRGCARNWVPFLIYGLVSIPITIAAMIPLGLGLLIWAPVIMASIFASYRQIYTNAEFE